MDRGVVVQTTPSGQFWQAAFCVGADSQPFFAISQLSCLSCHLAAVVTVERLEFKSEMRTTPSCSGGAAFTVESEKTTTTAIQLNRGSNLKFIISSLNQPSISEPLTSEVAS
jgi:hypothetical protein